MAKFLTLNTFASQEKRVEHRANHRVYLHDLAAKGKIVMAGPFLDETGGLIIWEVENQAEIEALIAQDPFTLEGVFATTEIIPWKQVAP